ncbi:DUF2312 domain-containing protein [Roseibium sediminicola]|uniref:DUF2312 domain-containing protein n=1 Tax=Roseibium sediminicola TaxID=2933272 RepID=A0ABT0H0I3_9HYPH|nr:DUF2312 domain-containing protein [Roseibium sp. CAU 1639]MCK7615204.1 DUF2312 domain-containing protein [Roseibium sp. CAU 1639]
MATSPGRNTVSASQLQGYIDRIERLRAEKKQIGEDEKAVFAELKAAGFTPARVRDVLKIRDAKPGDYDEAKAELDMYLHALGMERESPLFQAVGLMDVDITARDQVIEAFKLLVPKKGEIIVKIGKTPVRLWRDSDGEAHAEDYREPKAAAQSSAVQQAAQPRKEVPDVDDAGAEVLGAEAYKANEPITSNPFPWDDKRRQAFDKGWRDASGTDGMGPGGD